jgi:hypothetical protein
MEPARSVSATLTVLWDFLPCFERMFPQDRWVRQCLEQADQTLRGSTGAPLQVERFTPEQCCTPGAGYFLTAVREMVSVMQRLPHYTHDRFAVAERCAMAMTGTVMAWGFYVWGRDSPDAWGPMSGLSNSDMVARASRHMPSIEIEHAKWCLVADTLEQAEREGHRGPGLHLES